MRTLRGACLAVAAVAGLSLAGCRIDESIGATCSTSPPTPHSQFGTVDVSLDAPLSVVAGMSFAITVDHMTGYPGPPGQGGGSFPSGVLSVTGAVSPAGDVAVGESLFGGEPYPNVREFTATGEPGDVIVLAAVRGSSFQGSFPQGVLATCNAGGYVLAEIEVVAPPD